jgi:oxalate decarboxylase/phosphoglucose isomerase-like protein (cupin superfamily)
LSILAGMEKDKLLVGSDEVVLHVTTGALLAAEVRLPPGGGPPALHRHDPEEIYRVDHGALVLYVEDEDGELQRVAAGPGDVVHIPGGRPHTVRNESAEPASAYVVFSPGAQMERFLRAAAALGADGPPAVDDLLALAARHGVETTRPL